MYLFYLDESGTRDPSPGTPERPKDHIYVLLAVGMYEGQWQPFETEISDLKLKLIEKLKKNGKDRFELADCEVKANWVRIPAMRKKRSPFLRELQRDDLTGLTNSYFEQVIKRKTVILASVIDKRFLPDHLTHETLHLEAYEFLLELIQHYMGERHPKHKALVVMDDTSKKLNRAVAMKHARLQRVGNRNMRFPAIIEYPFFARSELSNGVQLADLLAYNVYRAFRDENFDYPYFERLLPNFYQRRAGMIFDGLKVWPDRSPLVDAARAARIAYKQKAPRTGGG